MRSLMVFVVCVSLVCLLQGEEGQTEMKSLQVAAYNNQLLSQALVQSLHNRINGLREFTRVVDQAADGVKALPVDKVVVQNAADKAVAFAKAIALAAYYAQKNQPNIQALSNVIGNYDVLVQNTLQAVSNKQFTLEEGAVILKMIPKALVMQKVALFVLSPADPWSELQMFR